MTKFSTIQKALLAHNISLPNKEFGLDQITRWGENNRFWASPFNQGYCFGDWKTGLSVSYFPNGRKDWEKTKKVLTINNLEKNKAAAKEASKLWHAALKDPFIIDKHSYLVKKKVFSYSIKQDKDKLIIPLYDIDGKLWSLQLIDGKGSKKFLKGGRKKGCFYPISLTPLSQRIYVCEGYATGASIYMATSDPVVVAFDVGNLSPVIEQIKKSFPHAKIIIAADNDLGNPENPGKNVAEKIAVQYQCDVVFPQFSEETLKKAEKLPSDFNDLHVFEGLEEVRRQLKIAGGSSHD